jgi:hypothetical protein
MQAMIVSKGSPIKQRLHIVFVSKTRHKSFHVQQEQIRQTLHVQVPWPAFQLIMNTVGAAYLKTPSTGTMQRQPHMCR